MKYFIAFAGVTGVVSAIGVTTVNPKCNFDYCLRNIIASNLPTRAGYADCTSFLLTTITPSPAWQTVFETTTDTTTEPTTTITTTVAFSTTVVIPEVRRGIQYLPNVGGFRKIKRQETITTAVTVTNTPPPYIVSSCTQLGTTLATDRYSSACACVGATAGDPTFVAIPTLITTQTVPDPSTTVTVIPSEVHTAYSFKATISGAPTDGTLNGKYIAPSSYPVATATLLVPTASAAAGGSVILIEPNGRTSIDGKLVAAKQSSIDANIKYLVLSNDDTLPVGATDVTCAIDVEGIVTCVTEIDFATWILNVSTNNSLRLLKLLQSPTSPAQYVSGIFVKAAIEEVIELPAP